MHVKSGRTFPLVSSTALLVFNLFFFGPFNVYHLNLGELAVSLLTILSSYVLPAVILALLMCSVGFFLSEPLFFRYLSIIFTFGVLTWLQGNFILWEYGMLDGQSIDWTKDTWRGWIDGALWIVLLVAAFFFYKTISKAAALASTVLVVSQLTTVAFTSFEKPHTWTNQASITENDLLPPDAIYEFSPGRGDVIHVIFDGFPSYAFETIINEQIEYYREVFEGFIFFKETVGAFPTTYVSVPAFMSGKIYRNDVPMRDFLDSAMGGKTITNVAYDSGYDVDFVDRSHFFYGRKGAKYSNFYHIPVPYQDSSQVHKRRNSALMLDMVLFRSVPHFLKDGIYNNQLWLFQRWFDEKPYERFIPYAHSVFFEEFINSMSIGRGKPVYKLVHLFLAHGPFIVDQHGKVSNEPLPFTLENAMYQYRASLDQFVEFLEKLKALGVYDSTLIILHSDHGQRAFKLPGMNSKADDNLGNVASSAVPLMLVKPPHSTGALEISKAPTMLTDLPATVSSILNLGEEFDGVSMLELSPSVNRVRSYRFYEWISRYNNSDYMDWIEEYSIEGSPLDKSSWRSGSIYRPGSSTLAARSESGVDQDTRETPEYSFGKDEGQLWVSDGSVIPIKPGALVGRVELARADAGQLLVGGWAVDLGHGEVPRAIVIFNNGEFLYAGRTDRRCPNRECRNRTNESRARYGNKDVAWAGFRVGVSTSSVEDFDKPMIRVFAVSKHGMASELAYPENISTGKRP